MKDDISQIWCDAFPAPLGISDSDSESREDARAEKRDHALLN